MPTCINVHREIFRAADPSIAGKLRTADCTFGRRRHERKGTAPEQIARELRAFHPNYPPTDIERGAWWGARLLQRFFAIHPFEDGNGRTARLLMTWGIEESGDLRVKEDWHQRGEEQQYIAALEFAHANDPRNDAPDRVNHLRPLAAYLSTRIALLAPEELLEIAELDETP